MLNPFKYVPILSMAIVSGALADPYSDIYVFGDSLFDSGNLDGVRFTNRVGPDYNSSDYGPVSPDLIADGLGLERALPSAGGDTNYAVGANRSLQTLQSINAETTYAAPAGPSFNSLFYDLEQQGRELDRNAMYLLDGGGNDIGNGLVFDEASAGVAASNIVGGAVALKDRGANYVVITNVPDFGLAPAGISVQEFASAQAASINDQIRQQVGNSNILIFDAFTMLQEIAADPASYGIGVTPDTFSFSCFDDGSANCTQGNAEAKIDGASPDPDQFMFNDTLHPTTIGQTVTADYVLSVLSAPSELSLLPEMALDDMQAHWQGARPVMRSNRWSNSTAVHSYTVWGGLNGVDNERDTDFNDTGENKVLQYNLGVSYRFNDSWYLGGSLGRADNELEYDSDSKYKMESLSFTVLSGYRSERWFAEALVSYSDLDYNDLKRRFSLGPVLERTEEGDTEGETWAAAVSAGYNLLDSGSKYRFGPLLGYDYVDVTVDGYSEKGGNVTALMIDDQDVTTGIVSTGVFGDMQLGLCNCELYSELVYLTFTGDSDNDVRLGLLSVEGNSAQLPGYERDDDGWRWDIGLAARLSQKMELNVGGGAGETDGNDTTWIGGELSYSF
jgi:outer membrane lipase/esterase